MSHGRMLAVHDISCVGRCSLTVALPIISSIGIECSVLPTAVLSTHTGGFQGFTYRDLTDDIRPIQEHWKSLGLDFDAFYTGFLGSFEQIDLVCDLLDNLSNQRTIAYVDPVMGDKGDLYSVFDMTFPKEMRKLCERADVLIPNLTELSFLLDEEYRDGPYEWEYIESMLKAAEVFGLKKIVITGVSFESGKVGAVFKDYETGETGQIMRDMIEGYYHGTGDVFSSALVGALESGISLKDSVRIAVDYTVGSIERTHSSGADVRYGVDFEEGIGQYVRQVEALKAGPEFLKVTTSMEVSRVAGMAARIWPEAYKVLDIDDQIDYMVTNMQSFDAISKQISEGYSYYILRCEGSDIGYLGIHPDEGGMFLSKFYIDAQYRGMGLSSRFMSFLRDLCLKQGIHRIHLTVNRENHRAIEAYKHMGFRIHSSVDMPIGNGFEMNDYIMELLF